MKNIPLVKYGLIGGSGTWGARFPEDYHRKEIKLREKIPFFKTPYGKSAPFKLFEINGEKILRVANHGWTMDEKGRHLPNWVCARQIAWVFEKAGVKYALADGSVGGIKNPEHPSEPLSPWSVVTPHDLIMINIPPEKPIYGGQKPTVRMREPFCFSLRNNLYQAAVKQKKFKTYKEGIYITTSADRFETEAEINIYGQWGANVVGQTLGYEAPLMRNLGIHFASLNIVANVAEGHVIWVGKNEESMAKFYHDCAMPMGNTIIDALIETIKHGVKGCNCQDYLLKGLDAFPVKDA